MRKIISSMLVSLSLLSLPIGVIGVSAANTNPVSQFEIIAPANAKVGEAIDVTVRAIGSDKKVVTTYRGSIIFVPENFGDTVPMPGRSITYNAEDNGEKKFSKGVIFKSAGKQKISVVDVVDDISGEAYVTVGDSPATDNTGALEQVTVVSPAKDSKITSDVLVVSGKSRKNSKLNITLNGVDMGSTLSDESGVFTKSLSGVTQAKNVLSVTLIDGTGKTVGKSEDISFEKIAGGPAFNNLTISPGTEVDAGSKITLNIDADANLSEVTAMLDNTALKATEGTAGKYTIDTVAPAKGGDYTIAVNLTNSLGQKATTSAAGKITVKEKMAAFENVKATTDGTKVVFNFGLTNPPAMLDHFKIAYGDNDTSFGNEVATWNTGKILKADGKYEWYIDKLPAKKYVFKIIGLKADGTIIESLSSETLSVTVGKTACTIGNVGTIKIDTRSDKSILSWDSVNDAVSYNIYKVGANGESTLFQNTKDTKYTLFLSSGSVVHEDFAIKALCDEKTESADFSKASKVQTGPGMLPAILVIISGILGAVILRRRSL